MAPCYTLPAMSNPPTGQDLAGTVLAGKFRLLSKLGEGGMSTVWRAENLFVKKTVAVKLMHPEYARNPRTLDRFRNEATSAGRIGNPHICDILDFGQSELGPYIIMEMLAGESFADLLERCGRIDPGLAVLIIRQSLRGLSAAHAVGIVHRDLKPENVFLHYPEPNRMVVKLMDFGISKFTEEMGGGKTGANVLMGTPEYMSPEQAEGAANVDARTDIWAMGVMLYRAITGADPFRSNTLAATLLAVTTKDPPSMEQVLKGASPELAAVVQACLAKDPNGRYPSSDALSQALAPFEAPPGTLPPAEGEAAGTDGSLTMPSVAQANPSLPTYSSANQQLEMARAASLAGEEGAGTAAGTAAGAASVPATPIPATPVPATPTTPAVQGAQTWSNELSGPPPAAEQSWTMGEAGVGQRPKPVSGGGSGLIIFLIVGLLVIGGGVGFFGFGPGRAMLAGGGDTGAESGGPAETSAAGETGEPVAADATAGDTAAAEGTTGAAEGTTGANQDIAATTGDEKDTEATGEESTGTTTGAAEGTSTTGETAGDSSTGTTGTTTGDSTTSGGDGGATTGGSGGGTKPNPDKSKVFKSGNLYTHRNRGPQGTYTQAMQYCLSLRKKRFARLRGWRSAKVSEIKRFANVGVTKTLYWSKEQSGRGAKTVNLFSGKVAPSKQSNSKPRAFCVASK